VLSRMLRMSVFDKVASRFSRKVTLMGFGCAESQGLRLRDGGSV
jgi:hypothetical protein